MQRTVTKPIALDVGAQINASIEAFFSERILKAAPLGGQYPALWRAARQASRGGKKLRPALVVNVYQELAGGEIHHAIEVATAFELLHTAFLLHDDVIDRDTVRRGELNIVGSFGQYAKAQGATERDALLWGQASAILAGDLLIQSAQSILARLPVPEHQRLALIDLMDHSVFVTAAGELADVAFATGAIRPAIDDVLLMTEHKTASYSFEGPLLAGAILANAPADHVRTLREFGRIVGTAFQLRDDILGIFGDQDVTGKSALSDLRGGKITPMVAYALQSDEARELRNVLGRPELGTADVVTVRSILERCGARAFIEDLMIDHLRQATRIVESSTLPTSLQLMLHSVAERATVRRR